MSNARQWQMISTVAVGGFLTAFIVAGCGGGSGGSLFSGSNNTPTPVPTTSGTLGKTPAGTPQATPGRTPVGAPTPKPSPTGGTPLPTPVPNSLYTSFGVIGTLDASGTFTQNAGFFSQSRLVRSTGPTPTPIGGTPEPTPTPLSATLYTGTYSLSNGEKGIFSLVVPSGRQASGGGAPAVDISGYTLQPVTSGDAVVNLKINGSTGSGTVTLGTVATGIIQITSKQSFLRAGNTYRHLLNLMKH